MGKGMSTKRKPLIFPGRCMPKVIYIPQIYRMFNNSQHGRLIFYLEKYCLFKHAQAMQNEWKTLGTPERMLKPSTLVKSLTDLQNLTKICCDLSNNLKK